MKALRKAPTLRDVARFARVSTASVSRALSNPEKVSDDIRQRVLEAVQATAYTVNQAARSLRQHKARTILINLPDIRNSFFSVILDAVEREAALRGYGVLVANRLSGDGAGRRLQDYFLSNRADGFLLLDGSLDIAELRALTSDPISVPTVLCCEEIPNASLPIVKTDNVDAAAHATRHLIELGHSRIGHIPGPPDNVLTPERLSGFTQAMADAGLPIDPEWILPGGFQLTSGQAAAQRFLELTNRPTAVFAANDESAIGFLSTLHEHGLECPRDISIVGFDDIDIATHLTPPLTTMRQPREELGRLATKALIDLLESPEDQRAPLRIVLRSELILRSSTAPLPRAPI